MLRGVQASMHTRILYTPECIVSMVNGSVPRNNVTEPFRSVPFRKIITTIIILAKNRPGDEAKY